MAFYKLPRLQKISGDFSALPLPLQSCASASPFGASPWPLQGRTVPSLPSVPVHGRTASWQPRGVPFGGIWAYRWRTWAGGALVGLLLRNRVVPLYALMVMHRTCAVEHCWLVRLRHQTAKPPTRPRKNRTK